MTPVAMTTSRREVLRATARSGRAGWYDGVIIGAHMNPARMEITAPDVRARSRRFVATRATQRFARHLAAAARSARQEGRAGGLDAAVHDAAMLARHRVVLGLSMRRAQAEANRQRAEARSSLPLCTCGVDHEPCARHGTDRATAYCARCNGPCRIRGLLNSEAA